MPLHIIREDITRLAVDAIVTAGSAAPGTPQPTGGVNGRIHQKAGSRLLAAIRALGGVKTGRATITEAYELPCKYVIHTAGPKWQGGGYGEEILLRNCYREALQLAKRKGLQSIAFPLISSGKYGYPKAEALRAATGEIRAFLADNDMDVALVVYDRDAFQVSSELFRNVEAFIDQHYVDRHYTARNSREELWAEPVIYGDVGMADSAFGGEYADAMPQPCAAPEPDGEDAPEWDGLMEAAPRRETPPRREVPQERAHCAAPAQASYCAARPAPAPKAKRKPAFKVEKAPDPSLPRGLAQRLNQLDEGFSQTLLRLIDEKGLKDSVCYRRANVDRKLFNKIKNTPHYTPRKSTVAAFCIALRLNLSDSRELLSRAGYALSHASMFDVIVEYFITRGEYDVDLINQVLFSYDQPLLGSNMG